jgi:hypothetical protein
MMKNTGAAGPNDVALAEQRVENRRALARAQWADVTRSTQRAVDNTQRLVTHPLVLVAIAAAGVFAGQAAGKSHRAAAPKRAARSAFRGSLRDKFGDTFGSNLGDTLREKRGGLVASLIASVAPFLMRQAMSAAQDMLLKPRSQGAGKGNDSSWQGRRGLDGSGTYRQNRSRGAEGPRL